MGGIIVGLVIALMLSCVVYLVGMKKNNAAYVRLAGSASAETTDAEDSVLNSQVGQKLSILEDSIQEYYLGDVTNEQLENGLYRGLVEATGDPYAEYYTEEELEELKESTSGIYYGIGAYVGIDAETQCCKISGVIDNAPAQEAGLQAEDIIVEVDGTSTRGMATTDVVMLIKGEEHTDVVLTIYRKGEPEYLDITVTRRKVEAPTVEYEMMEDGMAYIQITQFETVTIDQFAEKLEQARSEGMKGLIIDLRGNPGGTLQSAVEIARMILPKGLVVYMEDKNGEREEYSCDGKQQLEVPLVVLVDDNSASAAEILAGAVKDYGIGTLVGVTTFGKGIVQKVFGITDGSGVKLTISHYYTPKGNDIHEVGIEPDVEVKLDTEKYVEDGSDNQLERAKEILSEEMK
nr:S41 family peptidase [Lachnospiraceae bacterium]